MKTSNFFLTPVRVAALFAFALFTTVGAWAENINYVDANGASRSHEATILTGSDNSTTLAPGWYAVNSDVTYNGQLQFSNGDVYLILCNDKTLTITSSSSNALQVEGNLTIYSQCATIDQKLGALKATSVTQAGIRANNNGNITINGGHITTNTNQGSGISTTGIITINSGIVNATSSWGSGLRAHAINLGWYYKAKDCITTTSYLVECNSDASFSNIPSVITANKPFTDSDGSIYSGILTPSAIAGKTLTPYSCLLLVDDADNSVAIGENSKEKNVCLQGRTLFKDGAWNTLCLPFALDNLDGTPLAGATLMELDAPSSGYGLNGFDPETGTLYLGFRPASKIEAGKPYIIKWAGNGTDNIVNPVFTDVTINTEAASDVTYSSEYGYTVKAKSGDLQNAVEFRGNYSPVRLTPNDKSVLFLGTRIINDKQVSSLYYPNAANNSDGYYHLNACRAYFYVDLDGANAHAFVLNFGDDATSIGSLTPNPSPTGEGSEYWYDLSGRKLDHQPTQKGVYIHSGKKVVVK